MTKVSDNVAWSLTNAGIGKKYHDRTLETVPKYGKGLFKFLTDHGDAIRDGTGVIFSGTNLHDGILLFCRGLHINGVGCKILPLVHMRRAIMDPELAEEISDAHVLVIMPAQNSTHGCPISDSFIQETEYLIRKRHANDQSTFLHMGVRDGVDWRGLNNCYWSDEFRDWTKKEFIDVFEGDLE